MGPGQRGPRPATPHEAPPGPTLARDHPRRQRGVRARAAGAGRAGDGLARGPGRGRLLITARTEAELRTGLAIMPEGRRREALGAALERGAWRGPRRPRAALRGGAATRAYATIQAARLGFAHQHGRRHDRGHRAGVGSPRGHAQRERLRGHARGGGQPMGVTEDPHEGGAGGAAEVEDREGGEARPASRRGDQWRDRGARAHPGGLRAPGRHRAERRHPHRQGPARRDAAGGLLGGRARRRASVAARSRNSEAGGVERVRERLRRARQSYEDQR